MDSPEGGACGVDSQGPGGQSGDKEVQRRQTHPDRTESRKKAKSEPQPHTKTGTCVERGKALKTRSLTNL